jgi:tape measure domain-containing protein
MAAPQLRLEVSLNLTGFRNEVRKLTQIAQSEFNPLLKVNVDTKDYRAQLKALERIKPVIKIEDSQLDAARARIGTLNKSLATLRRATSTPIEIKLKYVEVGKPPSAAAGQIGQAVSGRIKADQAAAVLDREQAIAARNMLKAAGVPVSGLGKSRSLEAYRKSIIDGMTNAGKESIAGLAQGLKNGQSAIGQAAKTVGDEGVRAIKATLGIKSPSEVYRRIGQFSVGGLTIGFLDKLKDFKSKSVAEIRKIVALMRFELAKVSDLSGTGGASVGSLRQQLVGQRAYTSPIGPLPMGSRAPWAQGTAGQLGGSGYEPRMVSRPYGQPYPAAPGSFLQFSRSAGQSQGGGAPPPARTPGSFLGFSQRATQVTQVAQRQGGGSFPSDNMMGRSSAVGGPSTPLSLDYYKNAVKYSEALKVANASTRNFSASQIPLIGGIKNLAGEFGQAAKQVLLYGTAYKGLAFLTSLPGQILNAAKSQQQFTNGLKVATQDTGAFAKELLYVDNVQRAFGLNLETTRTGFTRLYASMAPTGFDSGSIEKLFTGISAATAALQLTPDKAERVIYAFGQMASKGQIMSEELKGQLGDVLPGALAIFAKAAGMSVKEFSEAMEKGEFVGNRFREVFAKVSDELIDRFGSGARAAGQSLQGLINTVGGDFKRTLESFAPLANSAAQAILGPLGASLSRLSNAAKIAFGETERLKGQIEKQKEIVLDLKVGGASAKDIKAAETEVLALQASLDGLNEAMKDPATANQAKQIEAFVEELTKAGNFVKNMADIIGNALSPVLILVGTNFTSVAGTIASFVVGITAARLVAMAMMGAILAVKGVLLTIGFLKAAYQMRSLTGAMAASGVTSRLLATLFQMLGIQATTASVGVIGLRGALIALLASTGIGALIAIVGSLGAAFLTMGNNAKKAAEDAKNAVQSIAEARARGDVATVEMELSMAKEKSRDIEEAVKAARAVPTYVKRRNRPSGGTEDVTMVDTSKIPRGCAYQGASGRAYVANWYDHASGILPFGK